MPDFCTVTTGAENIPSLTMRLASVGSTLLPWKGDGQCDICIIGGGYTGLVQRYISSSRLQRSRVGCPPNGWGRPDEMAAKLEQGNASIDGT